MRYTICLILTFFIAFECWLYGQKSILSDTIRIKEIVIDAKLSDNITGAYRQTSIDADVISGKTLLNLSDLLSESVPLSIKAYGPGSLATISLRGTGAVHTRVAWNGLVINSPMLGQTDLSIIPASFADEVKVDYGSRSMFSSPGAFGGLINIATSTTWENAFRISSDAGTGSYGLWNGSVKAETGNGNFQTVTRIFLNTSKNNFRFLNKLSYPYPVYERRTDSEYSQKALMQELFFKGTNKVTSASVWAQSAERNIPSGIFSSAPSAGERQRDESVRAVIKHSEYFGKSTFELVSGIFFENLNYFNRQASINSINHSASFTGKASWEYVAKTDLRVKLIITDEFNVVHSVNYAGVKKRNIFNLTAIARKRIFKDAGLTLLFNETADGARLGMPDYSGGFEYYISGNKDRWVKFNHSKNTRLPTLNDMFWNPGGNPDIRREYCFSEELGAGVRRMIANSAEINFEAAAYTMRIRDMIQWMPGEYSYWTPVNYRSVNVRGAEINTTIKYNSGKFKLRFSGNYAFNNSFHSRGSEDIKGKKLIYVPLHRAGGILSAEYSQLYVSLDAGYTGKRYITPDNSSFLEGFFLIDPEAGINIPFNRNRIGMKLRIENIMNTSYETIAWYPMPGRRFLFSLNYRYGK